MPNRLASASSPYLLQHRDNPVDWYEWGDEALAAAQERDVPILLSVGYSACHWCHVMAHESFEDDATADVMNGAFVNVKVDREERPDVDRIYMDAVQAMTGRGGWPMTVFLMPDGRPFYAGTYFPKRDHPNFPSFRRVLTAVSSAWNERRDELIAQAGTLTDAIRRTLPAGNDGPSQRTLIDAYEALRAGFDPVNGGFGGAPKFPQAPTLEFLLRMTGHAEAPAAASMLRTTLDAMAAGGIHDHLGGGFARYSVDAEWSVPHFEKMLYDNALLARLYLRAWQVLGDDHLKEVAVAALDYMLSDLLLPDGGLASAEDADSEGVEGRFYVFSHDEFMEVAGDHGAFAADVYGVTGSGNFEGSNILTRRVPMAAAAHRHGLEPEASEAALNETKRRLLAARGERVRPGLDDKVITAWNGLALRALAEAGAILGDERYLEAARRNARFVLSSLRSHDGRLMRSWRNGTTSVPAFCEDYAAYSVGLFALYQATGTAAWYDAALSLADDMVELFADPDGPGFLSSGRDTPDLIADPKEYYDNPAPSANSLAADVLMHVIAYTGRDDARRHLDGIFRAAGLLLDRQPNAVGHLLAVAVAHLTPVKEVAIVGPVDHPETVAMQDVYWSTFRPEAVVAWDLGVEKTSIPLLHDRPAGADGPIAYVCRGFVCDAPVHDAAALRTLLGG